MQQVKLQNISFNKLKEFTSLGNKKNITIKGRFTLIGEYEVITKDGGESMTNKQIVATFNSIDARLDSIEKILKLIVTRLDKIDNRIDNIVKLNNLKE